MALRGLSSWALVLLLSAGTVQAEAPNERDSLSDRLLQQVEHWQEQARNGDANAMFNLGQYFRRGIGIKPDLQRARGYYQQAAELGHVGAQLNLGTLYYFAPDKPNLEQVEYWWQKAALQGDASAQYQLAVLYMKLPEARPLDALAWMTLARDHDHPQAEKALLQLKSSIPAEVQAGLPKRLAELRSAESSPSAVDKGEVVVAELETGSITAEHEQAGLGEATTVKPAQQRAEVALAEQVDVMPAPESAPPQEPAGPAVDQKGVAAVTAAVVLEAQPTQTKPTQTQSAPESVSSLPWTKAVYTVQLASLSDEQSAEAMMQQLVQRHAAVLAEYPIRVFSAKHQGKAVYRVQAGAFSTRADAGRLCQALKASGQGCFPSRLR